MAYLEQEKQQWGKLVIELVNGDSTTYNWPALAAGRKVDCIITDPPFGVKYRSRRSVTKEHDDFVQDIDNDKDRDDAIPCFLDAIRNMEDVLADECDMYVFTRWDIYAEWVEAVSSLSDLGFKFKQLLVWDKGHVGMGDHDASWTASHEMILYCKKGRNLLNKQRSSVLRFDRPDYSTRIHPTEKPVSLLSVFIKISTRPDALIADPFAGSASTLVAAEQTGRSAIGVEKDMKFYDLAMRRLSQSLLF